MNTLKFAALFAIVATLSACAGTSPNNYYTAEQILSACKSQGGKMEWNGPRKVCITPELSADSLVAGGPMLEKMQSDQGHREMASYSGQ